jgi:hypothetical protein
LQKAWITQLWPTKLVGVSFHITQVELKRVGTPPFSASVVMAQEAKPRRANRIIVIDGMVDIEVVMMVIAGALMIKYWLVQKITKLAR